MKIRHFLLALILLIAARPSPASAAESLCDSSFQDCRSPLIALIRAETVGIDVGFLFMEDQRYANVTSRVRVYPTYSISADMNFPPGQDYASRAVTRYNAEHTKIDADMYRVTDRRHTDAMIAAFGRGVPVRYMGETREYRDPSR